MKNKFRVWNQSSITDTKISRIIPRIETFADLFVKSYLTNYSFRKTYVFPSHFPLSYYYQQNIILSHDRTRYFTFFIIIIIIIPFKCDPFYFISLFSVYFYFYRIGFTVARFYQRPLSRRNEIEKKRKNRNRVERQWWSAKTSANKG